MRLFLSEILSEIVENTQSHVWEGIRNCLLRLLRVVLYNNESQILGIMDSYEGETFSFAFLVIFHELCEAPSYGSTGSLLSLLYNSQCSFVESIVMTNALSLALERCDIFDENLYYRFCSVYSSRDMTKPLQGDLRFR